MFYVCLYIFSLSVFYCRSIDFMSEINAFIHKHETTQELEDHDGIAGE